MQPNIRLTGPDKCVSCGIEHKVLVKFDRAPPVCHDCMREAERLMTPPISIEEILALKEAIQPFRCECKK